MKLNRTFKFKEVTNDLGLQNEILLEWIENEWIAPANYEEHLLDEEDVARIRLILDLKSSFAVNDEAIPIILNLIDQIHSLHLKIRSRSEG